MSEQKMVYVAADPSQPDEAWSIIIDSKERREEIAATLSEWIFEGANVERVPIEKGKEMFDRWMSK